MLLKRITRLLLLLCTISLVDAKDIIPFFKFQASGLVSDFALDGYTLYAATDEGIVDIYDLNEQKEIGKIYIDPIKTVQGKIIPARVMSIDHQNGSTIVVSAGKNGYRNVWLHKNHTLKKIIDESRKLMIKKARFTKDGRIIFGTFSSDVVLYDIEENYQAYNTHISESTLGDISLSEDSRQMVVSDESGTVQLIDVNTSKVKQVFSSEHRDNVYRTAYSKGVIITGGQDRRVGVYRVEGPSYHIKSDFLVYSVAISPSAKRGVYSSGVDNHLQLFNIDTKEKTDRLVGHYAVVTRIIFVGENALISSGDENEIFFWRLDQ